MYFNDYDVYPSLYFNKNSEVYIFDITNGDVYSDFNLTNKVGSLATTGIRNYKYRIDDKLYVEYEDGKYGWISDQNIKYAVKEYSYKYYEKTNSEQTMYEYPNQNITNIVIPKNTIFDFAYEYYVDGDENWYYVEYNGTYGWIKDLWTHEYSDPISKYVVEEETIDIESTYVVDDTDEVEETKTSEKKGLNLIQKITLAIMGAIILGVTVLVTIILINKKRKQKLLSTIE